LKDSYYTPEILANQLVNYVQKENISTVVDFCVGEGELLRAAFKRWPNAKYFGIDISDKAISKVKKNHSNWILSKCDFLKPDSRYKTTVIKKNKKGFDLVLLNPPFSCVGGSVFRVQLDSDYYNVSTAMFYLVESIKHLSSHGTLFAILPISTAYSQKDRTIWHKLKRDYNLRLLEELSINHFKNCSPSVILVSINTTSNSTSKTLSSFKQLSNDLTGLATFRGKISMHTLNGNSKQGDLLVHSTNIRNNQLENLVFKSNMKISKITGPAVLLPRVGLPNSQKICIIKQKETYALSDCVIGIKTISNNDAIELKNLLIKNWKNLSSLYKGTGAKYITIERLEEFLNIKNSHT
jgi:tRNA1(Val) A37 N6-methylase TrmN6